MCGKDVKSQLQMVRFITVLHKTKVKISLFGVVLNTTTEATTVASHGNEEKLL